MPSRCGQADPPTVNQAASSVQKVKTSHSLASGQANRGRMLAGMSAPVTTAPAAKQAKPTPTEIACKQGTELLSCAVCQSALLKTWLVAVLHMWSRLEPGNTEQARGTACYSVPANRIRHASGFCQRHLEARRQGHRRRCHRRAALQRHVPAAVGPVPAAAAALGMPAKHIGCASHHANTRYLDRDIRRSTHLTLQTAYEELGTAV